MASDNRQRWHIVPLGWIIAAMILAFCAGYCIKSQTPWWTVWTIGAAICAILSMRGMERINKRMRFVIDATLSGDFSYKFPSADVSREERESNEMLNHLVEHFEKLTNKVRQNEVFLTSLINLTDIGLAVADTKGDIQLHNKAALKLLERQALTNICQISEQAYIDLNIRKSDVMVNDKSFTLFTISDLRRQMQAIEVESWEKLTRVLTHEIMNSLTPIQSIAENMSGKTSDREMTEALDTISSSSRALMQFVRNFREFSILPEPKLRAQYLKPLLQSSVRIAESYSEGKHISIILICFPPDLMVYTDETLLSRVLINILKNAIEAAPKSITIEAYLKDDESVEISISNDGEPISEETAKHIFTPFFTTRESGNGIGLSLSRRIVTHLGGTLSLKTRPHTCFIVRL